MARTKTNTYYSTMHAEHPDVTDIQNNFVLIYIGLKLTNYCYKLSWTTAGKLSIHLKQWQILILEIYIVSLHYVTRNIRFYNNL